MKYIPILILLLLTPLAALTIEEQFQSQAAQIEAAVQENIDYSKYALSFSAVINVEGDSYYTLSIAKDGAATIQAGTTPEPDVYVKTTKQAIETAFEGEEGLQGILNDPNTQIIALTAKGKAGIQIAGKMADTEIEEASVDELPEVIKKPNRFILALKSFFAKLLAAIVGLFF